MNSPDKQIEIRIGMGSCCQAGGAASVYKCITDIISCNKLPVTFAPAGCVGMCHRTPLLEITMPSGEKLTYGNLDAASATAVMNRHFKIGGPVKRFFKKLTSDTAWLNADDFLVDPNNDAVKKFLTPQVHIATEHYGRIDPLDIHQYIAAGGYEALKKSRSELSSEEIIARIEQSGLRGRGGAGFPTGRKWKIVAECDSDKKYVICNGDEGDPGAFMDRMILESYPHRVLEGLLIAAKAVNADEILLYIRQEYPLAVQNITRAIQQARDNNLLDGIKIRVARGAGAFVCGEESALLESLRGRRGQPRLRPPYPAHRGLNDKPTLLSNVETYCCVPWIIRNGAKKFAAIGSAGSAGTKVFALAGKVARGGLVEAPMGMTISKIVNDIGGGVKNGKKFKAVQIGGPSGGCIPAELADTPIDYAALNEIGAMMGSGGLVVLDDTDCMVDIAAFFLSFTRDESCGQCTACRIGSTRMLEILDRIRSGDGVEADLDTLVEIAEYMQNSSLCALGKTAPNPVLTTLKYFRDEYIAHINGVCPAGVCTELITLSVNDNCIGCMRCIEACPNDSITGSAYRKHVIDPQKCVRCKMCMNVCPVEAIDCK